MASVKQCYALSEGCLTSSVMKTLSVLRQAAILPTDFVLFLVLLMLLARIADTTLYRDAGDVVIQHSSVPIQQICSVL
jgi:hypothetical protein